MQAQVWLLLLNNLQRQLGLYFMRCPGQWLKGKKREVKSIEYILTQKVVASFCQWPWKNPPSDLNWKWYCIWSKSLNIAIINRLKGEMFAAALAHGPSILTKINFKLVSETMYKLSQAQLYRVSSKSLLRGSGCILTKGFNRMQDVAFFFDKCI